MAIILNVLTLKLMLQPYVFDTVSGKLLLIIIIFELVAPTTSLSVYKT